MRLYIHDIKSNDDKLIPINEYTFTKSSQSAWFWDTRESAELARSMIFSGGITVKTLDGMIAYCTDFRVESRSEGGFAISCEHPSANDPSDHA